MPVISAMADGEATAQQILELRPHLRNCPGCRATLKALYDSSAPLSAVLPIPLAVVAAGAGEHISNVFMRTYEAIAGGFHERAVHSVTKAQAAIEAAAGGKVAAVAASAAAVAGGGYATVEKTVRHGYANHAPKRVEHDTARAPTLTRTVAARHVSVTPARPKAKPIAHATRPVNEFGRARGGARSTGPTEFGQAPRRDSFRTISAAASSPARTPPAQTSKPRAAPEFGSANAGGEFGP